MRIESVIARLGGLSALLQNSVAEPQRYLPQATEIPIYNLLESRHLSPIQSARQTAQVITSLIEPIEWLGNEPFNRKAIVWLASIPGTTTPETDRRPIVFNNCNQLHIKLPKSRSDPDYSEIIPRVTHCI